jgi:hypothetical protein
VLHERLVLGLGEGDAAEGTADIAARLVQLGRMGVEAGIGDRQQAGGNRELREPVEPPRALRRQVLSRVKAVDLGGEVRAKRRSVEARHPSDGRLPAPNPRPERVNPTPNGRQKAEPSNHNFDLITHFAPLL